MRTRFVTRMCETCDLFEGVEVGVRVQVSVRLNQGWVT